MASSILIVEDEPSIAELIAVNLSHAGFLPVRAFQTEQASQLMKEVLPDLVVLDWMLPGKSGVQFAKELVARIRAVLRRRSPQLADEVVQINNLRLDPVAHRVLANNGVDEVTLDLGPTEFRLLHFFMTHPERVHSRGQLLDKVWGDHVFVEERTVDVHIKRLRAALAPSNCQNLIETVRGSGYRLTKTPVTQ